MSGLFAVIKTENATDAFIVACYRLMNNVPSWEDNEASRPKRTILHSENAPDIECELLYVGGK